MKKLCTVAVLTLLACEGEVLWKTPHSADPGQGQPVGPPPQPPVVVLPPDAGVVDEGPSEPELYAMKITVTNTLHNTVFYVTCKREDGTETLGLAQQGIPGGRTVTVENAFVVENGETFACTLEAKHRGQRERFRDTFIVTGASPHIDYIYVQGDLQILFTDLQSPF